MIQQVYIFPCSHETSQWFKAELLTFADPSSAIVLYHLKYAACKNDQKQKCDKTNSLEHKYISGPGKFLLLTVQLEDT